MIKEKVKGFWKNHKKEIVLGTILGVSSVVISESIFKKGYKAGYIDGGCDGFHLTMDWFEMEFPGTKLHELYDNYKKANPDKIVYQKRSR